ncbi:MAG: TetR/AcrR family transcriptional regulator [Oscillospiraceae bacterium]|nr:TetR/AcrR family transcriptional regulator [Oscillospiraceae bacterium]
MENQRVRLSKSMLKDALFNLLKDKPIEKITIYEICDAANINRSTFYKHYGSQVDLLRDVYNDFFTDIERHLNDTLSPGTGGLQKMLSQMDAERDKCRILINSAPQQEFSDQLFNLSAIRTIMQNQLSDKYSEKHKAYIHLFFCHGGYAIIRKWLNAETPETPREIAELLDSLAVMLL